jgi:uncharacterized membrane protein YidH (DUF202 family)
MAFCAVLNCSDNDYKKMNKTLKIIGVILILTGIFELFLTYVGFQAWKMIIDRGIEVYKESELSITDWDIFWTIRKQWLISLLSIVAGIGIFWVNRFTWSLFIVMCISHIISGATILYNLTQRNDFSYENENGITLLHYIILSLSIVLLIGLFVALFGYKRINLIDGSGKWYYLIFTAIPILFIFFVFS